MCFAQRINITREGGEGRQRKDSGFIRRRRGKPNTRFLATVQRAYVNIVAQVLKSKPDQSVYTTTPTASVFDAITLMAEKNVGGLVVMDGERVVGIITERDYARKIALKGRLSRETPVRDIMTSPVMQVRPDQTSKECMVLMTNKRLRHLPVIDRGKLIGLVSIGDLVKDIISQQKFVIQQLEHYIHGERGGY